MAVLDASGREWKAPKPNTREIAVASIRDTWSTYPSAGLTPQRLASILKEADQGDIYRQMELFEEMEEKDPHLFSCLQTRKLAVANLDYEVVDASNGVKDKEIAKFIREMMEEINKFEDSLYSLLDAIGKGFAVAEIIWKIENGRVKVGELKWRPQKRFTFDDTGENLRLLTEDAPVAGIDIPGNKFIIHKYRAKSGILARGGIVRIVSWMYIFKNYDVKDWVAFAEIFGMPLRVGKYGPNIAPDDKDLLIQAITQLGSDAAAVIPEGSSIEFIEAMKTSTINVYETLANFCNREMSKAILGQTLTSEVGDKGSYAASKTHGEVRQDLIEADAKSLQGTIKAELIKPAVDYNFGPQTQYPGFKIHAELSENLQALATRDKTLVDMGVKIPASYAYKKYSIPEPQAGEEILVPAPPIAAGPMGASPGTFKDFQFSLKDDVKKKLFPLTRRR